MSTVPHSHSYAIVHCNACQFIERNKSVSFCVVCSVVCIVVVSQCSDIYIFLQIQNRRAEQLPAGQRDGGREPIQWSSVQESQYLNGVKGGSDRRPVYYAI